VTPKVGAAGAASPMRVVVVARRTIWSFRRLPRGARKRGNSDVFQPAILAGNDEAVCDVGRQRLFRAKEGVGVGFTARALDFCSGLLRGGCFARTLVGGALRLGVLAAAIDAAAVEVLLRRNSTRRTAAALRYGRRGAGR
jgi:hypothetical protein